jgi:hypothetical protein
MGRTTESLFFSSLSRILLYIVKQVEFRSPFAAPQVTHFAAHSLIAGLEIYKD